MTAGASFSTQPVFRLTDGSSNAIASSTVTINAYTDSSCITASSATIAGNTVITNSTGFASFTSFRITTTGTYYVKAIAGSGVSSECLSSVTLGVTAGSAASIVYTTQPSSTAFAGASFSRQPLLLVKDAYDNAVSGATITLSSYLTANCLTSAGNGVLSSTTGTSNSTGYVVFSGLSYTKSQVIYVLASTGKCDIMISIRALTKEGSGTACSSSISISPSSVAYLNWATLSNSSVTAGTSFTQPVLLLTDIYGNGIPSAAVNLSLYTTSTCSVSAPSSGLSGNSISTNSAGVATFTNFKMTAVGVYYIKATASSITSSCSGTTGVFLSVSTDTNSMTISWVSKLQATAVAGVALSANIAKVRSS